VQTVLAVACDSLVLRVLCALLKHAGYLVLSGRSADAALSIAARHSGPIDLLITDVLLPQGNGWELAQEIHHQRPALRVLFLLGSPYDVVRGMVGRGVTFLAKPFTFDALKYAVGHALSG
jgi:two-component system, cell cycle sensor histidine kinase and response regulator CckA